MWWNHFNFNYYRLFEKRLGTFGRCSGIGKIRTLAHSKDRGWKINKYYLKTHRFRSVFWVRYKQIKIYKTQNRISLIEIVPKVWWCVWSSSLRDALSQDEHIQLNEFYPWKSKGHARTFFLDAQGACQES